MCSERSETSRSADATAQTELVEAMVSAYREGFFPMADPGVGGDGEIGWYDPDPRGIIPIAENDPAGGFRVSKTLAQRVRSRRFVITCDEDFGSVIRACAKPRPAQGEEGTWIDERIIGAYVAMHEMGHAHSVEAWVKDEGGESVLVGGLYGVSVGGVFAGESMFSRPDLGGTDASKVCLVHLVEHLRRQGYTLLDTQFGNPHLEQFGCVEIPRDEYKKRLSEAVGTEVEWGEFDSRSVELR